MGRQGVVDGYGDAAGLASGTLEEPADLRLKGEVAALVLRDLHSIDPLQGRKAEVWF